MSDVIGARTSCPRVSRRDRFSRLSFLFFDWRTGCPRSCLALALVLFSAMSFPSRSAETKQATNSLTGVIELKGKVECEPPVLAENQTATKCRFKSESGEIYTLVSNRLSEALFADTNLHGKKLVVHGRVDAKARTLEI